MKRIWIWAAVLLLLAGCAAGGDAGSSSGVLAPSSSAPGAQSPTLREESEQAMENGQSGEPQEPETAPPENAEPELSAEEAPVLLYMGQATMRVVTPEGKVIYIDPCAGDAYDLPADLILVTHGHFDHCAVDKSVMNTGSKKKAGKKEHSAPSFLPLYGMCRIFSLTYPHNHVIINVG